MIKNVEYFTSMIEKIKGNIANEAGNTTHRSKAIVAINKANLAWAEHNLDRLLTTVDL